MNCKDKRQTRGILDSDDAFELLASLLFLCDLTSTITVPNSQFAIFSTDNAQTAIRNESRSFHALQNRNDSASLPSTRIPDDDSLVSTGRDQCVL